MARRKKKAVPTPHSLPILKPRVAGIDIGAREIYVAPPPGLYAAHVRVFETFTDSLHALRDWLLELKITSVAMESTGVYWIPLFEILEGAGIDVCLVNARHVKNIPGRKTDVQDSQWLQLLHAVGLLSSSFRPNDDICAIRTLHRVRCRLMNCASDQTRLIQKALTQMNIQIHHVISDICGVTGFRILDAILAGERDPTKLAELSDCRIKASIQIIARSLNGHWRSELLFCLRLHLETFRSLQAQMRDCDVEIQKRMAALESKANPTENLPPKSKKISKRTQAHPTPFNVRTESYRILGVDIVAVPAISEPTAMVLLSELGTDFGSKFKTAKHFSSWLGLCPDNRITGGKILHTKTRSVRNRVAAALRLAAMGLTHAKGYFGDYFRRLKAKLGAPEATTAMAHKLARILWHMIYHKEEFNPDIFAKAEERQLTRRKRRLERQATSMGLKLVPV